MFNTWVAPNNECPVDDLLIKVDDMSASWTYSDQKLVLEGINFEVNEVFPETIIISIIMKGLQLWYSYNYMLCRVFLT